MFSIINFPFPIVILSLNIIVYRRFQPIMLAFL